MSVKVSSFLSLFLMVGLIQAQSHIIDNRSIFASPIDHSEVISSSCEIIFDGIDQVEKIYVKEMAFEDLFSHTPDELKRQFANVQLLNCEGQLKQMENQIVAKLNIKINADKARGSYGLLQKGAMMRLKLSEGTTIYCYNLKKNKGKIYRDENYTLYRGHFLIEEKDIKLLKKHIVEHVGIVWSAGYEMYDMFNMDFFQRQLNCLGK